MPNPRVSDAVKRQRGTYRADRAEPVAVSDGEPEYLREYKEIARDAFKAASGGFDVAGEIAVLRAAEKAFNREGITAYSGTPYRMSALVELAAQAAEGRVDGTA